MRIALLNLPYDNNYGGNLQRYALMKVLRDMGHDVTHLNLRFYYHLPWYKKPYCYPKRFIQKYILRRPVLIDMEGCLRNDYDKRCRITEPFYQKYINHTDIITQKKQLSKYTDFDAFIVGSDQVWRKKIAGRLFSTMFFDFLPKDLPAKRIAYGVSLGVSENELSKTESRKLSLLYSYFDAVSVREDSALDLLKRYGWLYPSAIQVFDPTLLIDKNIYIDLINNGETNSSNGNLFCYILDMTEEKKLLIKKKEGELELKAFYIGLETNVSIEQWLRSFVDAKYVITDSYHGLLFSIIFNKPFYLIQNDYRGNARFEMIFHAFNLPRVCMPNQNLGIDERLESIRKKSIDYLINSLSL